jgi:hypothetical protein
MKEIDAFEDLRVNTCADKYIYIDKLYGPLMAEEVRIHLDLENYEWVVERQRLDTEFIDENTPVVWEEKARWNCQETNYENIKDLK